jgi:hypothetical protein
MPEQAGPGREHDNSLWDLVKRNRVLVLELVFGSVLTTVFGIVLGALMGGLSSLPTIVGVLSIILTAMLTLWIAYHIAKYKSIGHREGKFLGIRHRMLYWWIVLVLACLVTVPLSTFGWKPMVSYYTSRRTELANEYVRQTKDPVYQRGSRTYQYALLVEFGVRRLECNIDVEIDTGNQYLISEYYFGMPLKSDGSPKPVGLGPITIGVSDVVVDRRPPVYKAAGERTLIYPNQSLYVYFESDEPIEVVNAVSSGEHLELRG